MHRNRNSYSDPDQHTRYSPGMSRNAAAFDTHEGNFAAILERLTGHFSQPINAVTDDLTDDFDSVTYSPSTASAKANSGNISKPGTGRRVRSIIPSSALKTSRDKEMQEGVPLSYEKALRMHGRHGSTSDRVRDLPAHAAARIQPEQGNPAEIDPNGRRSAGQVEAGAPVRNPMRSRAIAKNRRNIKAKPSSKSDAATGLSKIVPASKGKPLPVISPSSINDRKPEDDPNLFLDTVDLQGSNLQRMDEFRGGHPGKPSDHELQRANRRSTVAVRLTEAEFDRLKDRAKAAGVSVSAYMRSCVVDAESLRLQVKQAISEMRSLSEVTSNRPIQEIRAIHSPSPENRGFWFRSLYGFTTAILGTLFLPGRKVRANYDGKSAQLVQQPLPSSAVPTTAYPNKA